MSNFESIQVIPEVQFAVDLAHKAGETMLRLFSGTIQTETKEDGTPVTIADTLINHMVIEAVIAQFPKDGVVGEEESTADYDGMGRKWICDPIDGTAGIPVLLNTPMFSLALVEDGISTVGVAYEPRLNQLFTAVRGKGSFLNGVPIHVSDISLKDGIIGLPPDYIEARHLNRPFMQKFLALGKKPMIFPGAVFRGCAVAQGNMVGFVHPDIKRHDIAAVGLIVTEAGGKVTDRHGKVLNLSKEIDGAVVSNGVAHNDFLDLFEA